VDSETAELVCLAEGAERYCADARGGDDNVWALEGDLSGRVLDMGSLPHCSAREHADPLCPIRKYDPSQPIRWVQGIDLIRSDPCWVPAILASYRRRARTANERFHFPISTGYAVHSGLCAATCNAILEVVERDAVAVTWLQMMSLPAVDTSLLDEPTRRAVDWLENNFMYPRLLDATTDLGIPIVIAVLDAPFDTAMRTSIACAAGRSLTQAAEKAVRELLPQAIGRSAAIAAPLSPDGIKDPLDGARYMGIGSRRHAFDFLSVGASSAGLLRDRLPDDPSELLTVLRERLSACGMAAAVVDMTTRELRDAGLCAVNVVIPQLQPVSFWPKAQFLAHPRLYQLPAALGHPVRNEEDLNPWPQPLP